MLLKVGPRALRHPTTVWIFIFALLFIIEYSVMLGLPMLFREEPSLLVAAFIDSSTITLLVAPVIWWSLVRPMRQVIRMRTQFLGDLFSAIESERRQTAHELHDGIGQELSLLISGLRSAQETAFGPTPRSTLQRGFGVFGINAESPKARLRLPQPQCRDGPRSDRQDDATGSVWPRRRWSPWRPPRTRRSGPESGADGWPRYYCVFNASAACTGGRHGHTRQVQRSR